MNICDIPGQQYVQYETMANESAIPIAEQSPDRNG